MDFVFQFGEFAGDENSFLSDFVIAIAGAFFGTGGALLLYYKQTRDQKLKENTDKEQSQKGKLKYLRYLLTSIILAVDKFVESLDEFCVSAQTHPADIPQLKVPSIRDFNRLVNIINQEEHYRAYITLIKKDNVSNIFSSIDYLYETIIDTEKYHLQIQGYDLERRTQFASSAHTMINTIVNSQQSLRNKYGVKDPNYIILNNAITEYYKSLEPDPSDFINVRNQFMKPLLAVLISIKGIDEINNVVDIVSKTNKLLEPILLSNKDYADQMKKLSISLTETNNKLKNLTIDLATFTDNYTFD